MDFGGRCFFACGLLRSQRARTDHPGLVDVADGLPVERLALQRARGRAGAAREEAESA